MRDVLIVIGAADVRGGIQLRWRRLARELARSRRVTVLTWEAWAIPRFTDEDGYRVIRLPALAGWDRDHGRLVEMANAVVSSLGGILAALLVSGRWQVAVGTGLHPEGVVAGVAARLLSRPFVAETWLVGPYGNVARLAASKTARPVVRLLSSAKAVLTATQEGIDELTGIGIPPDRIRMEIPAVDTERFAPPTSERRALGREALRARAPRVVVYAGRFDLRQKRLDLLIDAWRLVDPEGWELVLVGEGGDDETVQRLAAAVPGVRLQPWANDAALMLAGADAFALPTRFESPGYALFEGMATGIPGLASEIAVYRELEPDGVELVPATTEAWASALRHLTESTPEEGAQRGAAARRWVEVHLAPSQLGQIEAVLDG